MNMCEVSMEFRKLLHHEGMLDVAQELMGGASGLQLFHDQALYKPGLDPSSDSFGGNMQWHQDNGFWKCEPANLLSCWIALDDVTEDNGALRMVPGSFTTGMEGTPMPQAHREDGDAYRKEHIDPVFDVTTAETLAPLAAGSAVFHHCRCLHSSLPNRTARQRRAVVIHLMAPGTAGADGTVFESSWAQPILRLPRPVATAARSTARMQAVAAHLGGGDSAGQQPTPGHRGRRVPPPSSSRSTLLPPSAAANRIEGSTIPPPQYVHVPRLPAGSQASLDYLSEHGFCVVAAALTPTEVATALDLAWDFAEAVGDGRLQVRSSRHWYMTMASSTLFSHHHARTHARPSQMHDMIERL
jgi:hypothetical protein